jgi:hypothetical protein
MQVTNGFVSKTKAKDAGESSSRAARCSASWQEVTILEGQEGLRAKDTYLKRYVTKRFSGSPACDSRSESPLPLEVTGESNMTFYAMLSEPIVYGHGSEWKYLIAYYVVYPHCAERE